MSLARSGTLHAAVIEQLTHNGGGLWTRSGHSIVNAALLDSALPSVEEDGFVRPVYVAV